MWKNMLELDRPQMEIWLMHIACWITEATCMHACMHAHTHTTCMRAPMHTHAHARTQTHMHVHPRTYPCTNIHICVCTHTHMHTTHPRIKKHSEYVTLGDFPLKQCLRRHASMLHYTTLPVLCTLHYIFNSYIFHL
jgi:hypothetical protein